MTQRLFLIVFALVGFAAAASAQSIADVARAERARQKVVRSTVVIIGSTPVNSVGEEKEKAPSPAATTATAAPTSFEPKDSKGRDEKSWRATFQQAREDAKRAEDRVQILDLRVKQLNMGVMQDSSVYNREYRLGPEIAAAQKELEDARKSAEDAKKKIGDLEEELRRSGGPAGWGR